MPRTPYLLCLQRTENTEAMGAQIRSSGRVPRTSADCGSPSLGLCKAHRAPSGGSARLPGGPSDPGPFLPRNPRSASMGPCRPHLLRQPGALSACGAEPPCQFTRTPGSLPRRPYFSPPSGPVSCGYFINSTCPSNPQSEPLWIPPPLIYYKSLGWGVEGGVGAHKVGCGLP